MKRKIVPTEVNSLSPLDAVSLYQNNFDWVIHPLKGPAGGGKQKRMRTARDTSSTPITQASSTGLSRNPGAFGFTQPIITPTILSDPSDNRRTAAIVCQLIWYT